MVGGYFYKYIEITQYKRVQIKCRLSNILRWALQNIIGNTYIIQAANLRIRVAILVIMIQ